MLEFRDLLIRLIETPQDVLLPTLSFLSKLESIYIRSRPDVFDQIRVRYAEEKVLRDKKNRAELKDEAFRAAIKIVEQCFMVGRIVKIRVDGKVLAKEVGIPKAAAEAALKAALAYDESIRSKHPHNST